MLKCYYCKREIDPIKTDSIFIDNKIICIDCWIGRDGV